MRTVVLWWRGVETYRSRVRQRVCPDLIWPREVGLNRLARRMARLGTESAFRTLSRVEELRSSGRDIINLGIGAPDFETPGNIVEAGMRALEDGWHSYTTAKGIPALREAVSNHIAGEWGASADPDHIVIVPGGKPTLFFALQMIGEPGVEILYPDPGFPIYQSLIAFSGATLVPYQPTEATSFELDPDRIADLITDRTRLLILNSPSNPTGAVAGRDILDYLVTLLEEHPHVVVLSDEIYSRFVYEGGRHVSLLEYESIRDRLIILNGWSKSYAMTGWRLGWGVWPADMAEGAERLQINSNSCAPVAAQVAGIEALQGPQDAIEAMVAAFDERRKYLAGALDGLPGFEVAAPEGAFYIFAGIGATGLDSETMESRLLEEAGVAVLGGSNFGESGEGCVRFSYTAGIDVLEEAVSRISQFLMRNDLG